MSHYMLDQKFLLMKGKECAFNRDNYAALAADETSPKYLAYYLIHSYVCGMIATAIELVSAQAHSEIALDLAIELVKHYDKAIYAQEILTFGREEWCWATDEMVEFTYKLEWISENLC